MRKTLRSLEETRALAKEFLESLPKKGTGAEVLVLSGELGAGKTAFTKLLAKELGITERVISPTFILERDYVIKKGKKAKKYPRFTRLIHIDAYRFDSEKDLKPLRLEEKFKNPKNLLVVEWGERVLRGLPKNTHSLSFRFVDENTREVMLEYPKSLNLTAFKLQYVRE